MKYHIELTLAEELAAELEDARSYGLQCATFQTENGQVKPNSWGTHRHEESAHEERFMAPNTEVVRISEFLPALYQFIDQTPEQMQQAVNFYELKTQLETLGFNGPGVTDELRKMVLGDSPLHDVRTQAEGADFNLSFQKAANNAYQLYNIEASMPLPGMGNVHALQYFQPDVEAAMAIAFLKSSPGNDREPFRPLNLQETLHHIHQLKSNTMNTENLSYLEKQLLNLGFGESMNAGLAKSLASNQQEFTLNAALEYNKQPVDYTLHFKAGDDRVFFNKYDASLQGKDTQQTFYINKSGAITAKEAYNLMEGRAVYKQLENLENEKYHAWIILDKENKTDNGNFKLRQFNDKWNYKPERAIDKMDIVGINEPGVREKLMKSLEKGNRHEVTALKNGKEAKLFLEANPAEHRVNLTNWKGEAQLLEHYKKPELKADKKETQKESIAEDDTKKKRNRGQKMSA